MINRYSGALITILFAVMLSPFPAAAAKLSKGEKDTIYIGALKVQPSVQEMAEKKRRLTELKRIADSLESQLVTALNATRVFQLVEQRRSPEVEAEEGDSDESAAAQVGRDVGAKFAFLPQIDGFEDKSETTEYRATGRAALRRDLFLSVVVQVVDTASGKLLPDSPSVQMTKTEVVENGRIGQLSGSDEVIVALAREMAQKLSQETVAILRPAKVLAVNGRQVLFNRGSEAGFKKGDLVEFYSVQDVKDEESGEVYRNEIRVGQGVITRIEKNQSYAAINGEEDGIVKGCVVRFVKSAAARAAEAAEQPADVTQPDFGTKDATGPTPGSSEKPLKWK